MKEKTEVINWLRKKFSIPSHKTLTEIQPPLDCWNDVVKLIDEYADEINQDYKELTDSFELELTAQREVWLKEFHKWKSKEGKLSKRIGELKIKFKKPTEKEIIEASEKHSSQDDHLGLRGRLFSSSYFQAGARWMRDI